MMRIGIDVSALGCKSTGTGRFINCLLEQVYSLPYEIKKFSPANITVPAILSTVNKIIPNNYRRHIYRELLLEKEMKKEQVELAIFPDYFLPNNYNGPAAVVIHDLSFITHPQFYSKKFILFYNWKLKNTLSQNPVITTVSENTRKNIIAHLGIKQEDIFLLQGYAGLPVKDKPFEDSQLQVPYFLYVGHIEPRKNLPFLIKNFISWKHSRNINIKLIIAGELWISSKEISALLAEYKNHPDVEIKGYVSEKELALLYNGAAGYVNTSFVEGFGFPVAEAMKYKLPILCSEQSACEEISFPYSVAIDPHDNNSLIHGFDKLYSKSFKEKRKNYNEKYSPRLMQAQLNVIIERLESRLKNKKTFFVRYAVNIYEAVEKTLLYAQLHNSSISRSLLHERLFDVNASEEDINEAVIKLYLEGKVSINDDNISLNSSPLNFYVKNGRGLNRKRTEYILKLLSSVPFISGIAFSGGTAHYGLNNHDDVDLFIISKKHTLYISYFVIHVLSLLLNARKEICANYLVDESGLTINSFRDIYTANQIISLKVYKNESILNLFFNKNKWVHNYFPNFGIKTSDYKISSKLLFLAPVNYFLYLFYRTLYWNKIKPGNDGVIISKNCLKLHTNDHRLKTIKAFEKAWMEYKSGKDKVISEEGANAVQVLS